MGLFDIFSSEQETQQSGSRVVRLRPPSKAELDLVRNELSMANRQLTALNRLKGVNDRVFGQFWDQYKGQLRWDNRMEGMTGESLAAMRPAITNQDDLTKMAMENIRRGVQLSPDQEALIRSSADNAIESGLSDISRFRDESFRSLAQETSQARGLRPEDTPILDVGGRIANESSRQASQLISGVRSQEADMRLRYPIEAGTFMANQIGAQQQQGNTAQAFLSQLRNDAFSNRLNLIATTGTMLGNNAQFGADPNVLPALMNLRLGSSRVDTAGNVQGESSPSLFSQIVSGAKAVGGFMQPVPGGG